MNTIKAFGFVKNPYEPCVYKWVKDRAITFLILYVDDILLMGNDVGMMNEVKIWLSRTFSMKDLCDATYVLGIRVYKDRMKKDNRRVLLLFTHGLRLSKDDIPKDR